MNKIYLLLALIFLCSCKTSTKSTLIPEVKETNSQLKITAASLYEGEKSIEAILHIKGLSRHVGSPNHKGKVIYSFYGKNNELIKEETLHLKRLTSIKNHKGPHCFSHTFNIEPSSISKVTVSIL